MKRILVLITLPFLINSAYAAVESESATLVKIISTRALWGKDSSVVLGTLPAWNRIGETSVVVFPDRVLGGTPYKTPQEAQRARDALAQALSEPQPKPAPSRAELLKGIGTRPASLRPQVVGFFEDDSQRVTLTDSGLEFLAKGLNVKQLEQLIGKPEKVTTQTIQSKRDMRPVILTLRSYAGGSIIFAESDLAPRPGFVDRVFFDVRAVTAALFQER